MREGGESYTLLRTPPLRGVGVVIPGLLLEEFDLVAMVRCSAELRRLGQDSETMMEAAQKVASLFQDSLLDRQGQPACVLSRLFKLHPFEGLPEGLQEIVRDNLDPEEIRPDLPCVVLLGSRGIEPEWNEPAKSKGHRVIPLSSPASIARVPMFAAILDQLAFPVAPLRGTRPDTLVGSLEASYNVFRFAQARGCPAIPAQEDFVIPYGVTSTLGYGSYLPGGAIYMVALFTRVPVSNEVAELFRPLALSTRLALGCFEGSQVFPS